MAPKPKYPLITVQWADHFFCPEDMSLEEIKETAKDALIGTYSGYLVEENKRVIVLASNLWDDTPDEGIGPTMYIMKKAIVYRSDKDDASKQKEDVLFEKTIRK